MAKDINNIVNASEKKSKALIVKRRCHDFTTWIDQCGWLDLRWQGFKFTRKRPLRNSCSKVFKRLDKAMCNASWHRRFGDAVVKILLRIISIIIHF